MKEERTLYNEEKKMRYLETLSEANRNIATVVFVQMAEYEEKIGKDFADFRSINDVFNALKCVNFSKLQFIRHTVLYLKKYAEFCGNATHPIVSITQADYKYFVNMDKFNYITDEEYNDVKNNFYGVLSDSERYLKCLLMLCYEGAYEVSMESIATLRASNINTDTNEVVLTDIDGNEKRRIIISDELKELCLELSEMTCIVVVSAYSTVSRNITKIYPDSVFGVTAREDSAIGKSAFIKRFKTDVISNKTRALKKFGLEHPLKAVAHSGCINNIIKSNDNSLENIRLWAGKYNLNENIISAMLRYLVK